MARMHDIKKRDWERLLKDNGFNLDRTTKHHVWKHADGRTIPVSTGPTVTPVVARREVKKNRLEGAPFGWSDLWKKSDEKSAEVERQRQEAIQEDEEQRRQEAEQKEQERQRLRELQKARFEQEQQQNAEETPAEEAPASEAPGGFPVEEAPEPIPEETDETTTIKTIYLMNDEKAKKFHDYLCAVVESYKKTGTTKGLAQLAKQYQVKAINTDLFFQNKLDQLKSAQQLTQKRSEEIRLLIAENERKERQRMLDDYLKAQEQLESGGLAVQPEAAEPTLSDRIETFEARFELLGPVFPQIVSRVHEYYQTAFGTDVEGLFGTDSNKVRLSPDQYLLEWANNVEFDLTRIVFDDADQDEVRALLPSWNDNVLHAYLTWLYGGSDGRQLKLDFDARGCADTTNDQLIELLRDQHLLDGLLFVKLESWKGLAHCVAIYSDAPDVLMVVFDDGTRLYTAADDIWYTSGGDTVIMPDGSSFAGWGTRSVVGHCLRQLLSADNHKAAAQLQATIAKDTRGQLLEDINHYRDYWQMYRNAYEAEVRRDAVDFEIKRS